MRRPFPIPRLALPAPIKGKLPCVGYCLKQVQEKQGAEPERGKEEL